MRRLSWLVPWFVQLLLGCIASAQNTSSMLQNALSCNENGVLCTEAYDSVGYEYTGHDEPSLLFYSKVPGSGNTGTYYLRLPKDPPTLPKQDGTGGAFNFQLRPAFWVGMAMCDSQSAPNPNSTCTPDSDRNIFDGSDPTKLDYIGNHPGTAFMEMQFYPPGCLTSCDLTNRWCSALTIDSFSQNQNTGQFNNSVCENAVGDEPVNFAFITKSGVPVGPPSPLLRNGSTFTPTTDTLFYNPGDLLRIVLRDTTQGLRIAITDLTSGESGSMTASATNGFAQVLFDPNGTDCNLAGVPRMASTTWITVSPLGRRTILGVSTPRSLVLWVWYRSVAAPLPTSTSTVCPTNWSGPEPSAMRASIGQCIRSQCDLQVLCSKTARARQGTTVGSPLKPTYPGSKAIRVRRASATS